MIKQWKELLVQRQKYHGTDDEVWQTWGKLVRKRTQNLDLERYLATLQWYDTSATSPTLTETVLLPELTESLTSREWAENLLAKEKWVNEQQLSVEDQPTFHQVICAEMPWLIGCMFPDLTVGQRMLQLARDNFRLGLAEILDGSGLPHATNCLWLRGLVACWTRTLMIGKRAKLRPWPVEDHHQFEWAVLHALRLTRCDGTSVFDVLVPRKISHESGLFPFTSFAEVMRHALAFDTDEADHAVARMLFPQQFAANKIAKIRESLTHKPQPPQKTVKTSTTEKAAKQIVIPDATYFSEWAQMAVLRTGWGFREPSLTVDFASIPHVDWDCCHSENDNPPAVWSDQSMTVELNLAGQTIWSGNWDVAVRIDDRTLLPTDTWATTCEAVEEGGYYLEIELPLTENMRLQRHFLLCQKEKLLLLADSILPQYEDNIEENIEYLGFDDAQYAIEYESQLPLAPGIGIKSNAEMTELLLTVPNAGNATASNVGKNIRVFPLALPEWKAACESGAEKPAGCVSGELGFAEIGDRQRLILRQNACGRAMFAPMLFDLDAKHTKQSYTWRQLTVGENLERVTRDRAVAFRLQIDKMHVLLYRSLTSALNRTFFGHNLVGDFFAGRFDAKTGKVDVILETE